MTTSQTFNLGFKPTLHLYGQQYVTVHQSTTARTQMRYIAVSECGIIISNMKGSNLEPFSNKPRPS